MHRLTKFRGLVFSTLGLVLASGVWAAETTIGVREGTDKLLGTQTRTQGADTVHDEVIVSRYTHETSVTARSGPPTVTTTAANIFASATTCHSVILVADIGNTGVLYVGYPAAAGGSGAPTTAGSLAIPIYAGGRQQFRAPNNGSCEAIQVICSTGTCTYFAMAQ